MKFIFRNLSSFYWVFFAILLALILRIFIIGVFKVPTVTMMPTLKPGDFIISSKLAYSIDRKYPQSGDVIVFSRAEKPKQYFIKRVVASSGQSVEIKNGELIIDQKKCNYNHIKQLENFDVLEEICLNSSRQILRTKLGELSLKDQPMYRLGPNELFVLGDNRDASEDSRDWGPVKNDQVNGKAIMIWLSLGSTQDSISVEKEFRFSRFLTLIK